MDSCLDILGQSEWAVQPTNSTCLPLFTVVSQLLSPSAATHNIASVLNKKRRRHHAESNVILTTHKNLCLFKSVPHGFPLLFTCALTNKLLRCN